MKKLRIRYSIHLVIAFACLIQAILWFQWHHLNTFSSCGGDGKSFSIQRGHASDASTTIPQIPKKSHDASSLHALKTQNTTLVTSLARPFQRWIRPFPCFPAEDDWYTVPALRRPLSKGFMYFKARKAGSSTIAGIALRIARNMASKTPSVNTSICNTRFGHPPAWYNDYSKRDKLNSFLWTILREPTQRHISEFYHFAVSRFQWEPTDANFQYYFQLYEKDIHNYYIHFMKTNAPLDRQHDDYIEVVRTIMQEYNFIGILERLDESLVVLQMLLHLETSDILYLKSKVNGGYDDGVYNETCFYIKESYVSPQMATWFDSSHYWQNYTRGDNLLYATAYASLDLTIDKLGRREFTLLLERFRHALQVAEKTCTNVRYPCSPEGQRNEQHDCMWTDSGCGYKCLDQVAQTLGI